MNGSHPHALLAFHAETTTDPLLLRANWEAETLLLGAAFEPHNHSNLDLFALVVDARTGISQAMIDAWQFFLERQVPRMLLIQSLTMSPNDFDDIVLIGNRVLEKLATPYLVLHDEIGNPVGLIELETEKVSDYSSGVLQSRPADDELIELVAEFKGEYEEEFLGLGSDAFAAGIIAIALPIAGERNLGLVELNRYLAMLAKL